jgi:predicted RNA-binding protein with PIN domain
VPTTPGVRRARSGITGTLADVSAEQPIDVSDADLGAPDETPAVAGEAASVDVNAVSDLALRSALEFAVGIATAGQKLRPPLVYPPGLKAHLKFNRLDRTSLRAVRRAVAGDESFRSRLGEVATSDLVDELGMTWLRRPPGWEDQVRALQRVATEEAEQQSSEAARRKAERRREAAEQAAARATAELLAHHDAMAREQSRRERAEASAASAASEANTRSHELSELRRELDRLKQRVATEVSRADRAEQSLAEASARLAAAEATRDEVLTRLANRESAAHERPAAAVPPPVSMEPTSTSNDAAAKALAQAAAATRQVADALVAASRALNGGDVTAAAVAVGSTHGAGAPALGSGHQTTGVRRGDHLAGVRPLRPKPAARRPIAIPGGVYGDSLAAANHLLRTPGAVVLVDGYNVAKLAWPAMDLQEQRELCIEMLEDLARRLAIDLRVVFDGADVVGASAGRRLIRVQYSPPGVSADDVIRAEVRALPVTTPVVVVTNDQAIITDVRGDGANPVSSEMLLAACGRSASR